MICIFVSTRFAMLPLTRGETKIIVALANAVCYSISESEFTFKGAAG